MAVTNSAVFSAAMTFTLQKGLLETLRYDLKWTDPAWTRSGSYDEGSDMLMFASIADLADATTPLTEGTNPTAVALTLSTTTVSCAEYGNVVNITNLAKIKSPLDVVSAAREKLSRNAAQTLDTLSRNVIALSGTQVLAGVGAPATRAAIAATDLLRAADLRKLKGKMQAANVPTLRGDYVLVIHPYVEYDLKSDDDTGGWIDIKKYSDNTDLINGEIGKLEGFRVVVANNAPTVTSTVTVYYSMAFGGVKPFGSGDLDTLRATHVPASPSAYDQLGLNEYLGWHTVFGVAALDSDYYYRVETAATSLA